MGTHLLFPHSYRAFIYSKEGFNLCIAHWEESSESKRELMSSEVQKNESVILTHELMATVRESQKHLGAGEEISVS